MTKPEPIRLHLINRASPGDGLIMTAALRDLHMTYPQAYITHVESPFREVYANNPYWYPVPPDGAQMITMQYPLIHASGATGRHFTEGYRDFLEEAIGRPIRIPIGVVARGKVRGDQYPDPPA